MRDKKIEIKISEELHAELKICAYNVGVSPETMLKYFIEDLLSDSKNPAQTWFYQNLRRPRAV